MGNSPRPLQPWTDPDRPTLSLTKRPKAEIPPVHQVMEAENLATEQVEQAAPTLAKAHEPLPPGPTKFEERMARNEARLAETAEALKRQKDPEEKKRRLEIGRARMAKALDALKLKTAQKRLVREKVEKGLPITEEERKLLTWTTRMNEKEKQRKIVDAAAHLVIKAQSVQELRLIVEKTAARHAYNPIESLIQQTKDPLIPAKEKIAIHKALLPFLVPQLPVEKQNDRKNPEGVKVTITQFVFPEERPRTVVTETPAYTTPS